MRKILLGLIILLLIGLLGCSQDSLSLVKGGILDIDKSLTVGQAFDNYKYFKKVTWSAFQTENGRDVVEVHGLVDLAKHPSGEQWKSQGIVEYDILFQFIVNKDGESFELYTSGFKFKMNDGTEQTMGAGELGLTETSLLLNLQQIYNNQPIS